MSKKKINFLNEKPNAVKLHETFGITSKTVIWQILETTRESGGRKQPNKRIHPKKVSLLYAPSALQNRHMAPLADGIFDFPVEGDNRMDETSGDEETENPLGEEEEEEEDECRVCRGPAEEG